ncbi:hypothetical protein ACO0LH_25325 [Undibacterium sp. TJN19]
MNEEQLRAELDAVYASSSWKITAPLRYVVLLLKSDGWQRMSSDLHALMKKLQRAPALPPAEPAEIRVDRLNAEGKRILGELQSRVKNNQHLDF